MGPSLLLVASISSSLLGITDAARAGKLRLLARAVGGQLIDVAQRIVHLAIQIIIVKCECIQIEEESELPRNCARELVRGEAKVT
mmetsp:Transcript_2329/g.3927  ORF Transcript_2329/g.3927 Transcript_2329/m.3927 type:complete len:85 (-) Transcript_2329:57-311(-)